MGWLDWLFAWLFLAGIVVMSVVVLGGFTYLAVQYNKHENPWTENPWKENPWRKWWG